MADKKIIKILRNIAILLEIKGENPFKSRAYQNAAEIIKNNNIDIADAVRSKTIGSYKGIGAALEKKLTEYVETGKMSFYDKLISEIPESLVEITSIGGLGPKKVKLLYEQLGISSIEELEIACNENLLLNVKGFGEKTQEEILGGIDHFKAGRGKYLQMHAIDEARDLLNKICSLSSVVSAEFSDKVRRRCEVITEIVIIAHVKSEVNFRTELADIIDFKIFEGCYIAAAEFGMPIKIIHTTKDDFVFLLHNSTGSEKYLDSFNRYISSKGFLFNISGFDKNGTVKNPDKEEVLYKLAELQYIPPELREGGGIIEKAINNELPDLIEDSDLKGMLHVHTNWSDGINTIAEMALKTKELGFSYIGICDHSRSAGYTNGLSIERVKLQHEEMERFNSDNHGIRILKGIESDILSDGSLDYPPEVLASFDFIVASVHQNFKMSKTDMTKRIINAIKNPYTSILGHPTGRLLLARQPYELDLHQIIDAAADYGKIIELNANPYRLDLPWEYMGSAKEKGVKLAINPDSHKTSSLTDVFVGVGSARKGGLEASDVVNCLDETEFLKFINKMF